ncbi:hypothetical protein [Nitratifractor sp.]
MNTAQRKIVVAGLIASATLMLSGCHGKHAGGLDVPQYAKDLNDSSAAVSVPAGHKVVASEEGTKIRIFHYSNSDKLVCTVSGSAKIVQE